MFVPGTYSFDATAGGGNPETGSLNVTVGPNQLGMHMLFDWNGSLNIDVFVVANINAAFGPGIARSTAGLTSQSANSCDAGVTTNCLWDGATIGPAGKPAGSKVWMLSSTDGNADGFMGVPMPAGGPFAGFNANFNLTGTFSNPVGPCAGFVDTTPDAFAFTSVTNAPFNTVIESNTITVTGLGAAGNANISVTGGEYRVSTDGGNTFSAYTAAAGTVSNNNVVQVRGTSPAANDLTTSVALAIGTGAATFQIVAPKTIVPGISNFTMLDPNGTPFGGTNDILFNQTGPLNTNVATAVQNATMGSCSNYPFFGNTWTAYNLKLYGPGTYTIPTADQGGGAGCPFGGLNCVSAGDYTVTVNAGEIMAHMKFAWNTTQGIDVIDIWQSDQIFAPSGLYTGANGSASSSKVWSYMSSDGDSDGVNGLAMIDGPFTGYRANFNIDLNADQSLCPATALTPVAQEVSAPNISACSLSQSAVSISQRADWWLLGAFVGLLGALRLRRSTKH
jgi:hypothetical protein